MTKARLTPEQVQRIRSLDSGGVPHALIAAKFDITTQHVADIAHGRSWASVPPPVAQQHMDPEDAAVLIADESGHPYEWREIYSNRNTARRYLRGALRNTDPHSDLYQRLEEAGKALARRHRV